MNRNRLLIVVVLVVSSLVSVTSIFAGQNRNTGLSLRAGAVQNTSDIPIKNDCRIVASKYGVQTPGGTVHVFNSQDGAYVTVSASEFDQVQIGSTYCGNWTTQ